MDEVRPNNPTEAQSLTEPGTETTRIGVAIVEWQDHFLVGTRQSDQVLAGFAEFPGGKCEPDESAEAGAIRECLEETAIEIRVRKLLQTGQHTYPHGRLELNFFLCEPTNQPTEPTNPFRWIPRDELSSLPFPDANAGVIQMLGESRG